MPPLEEAHKFAPFDKISKSRDSGGSGGIFTVKGKQWHNSKKAAVKNRHNFLCSIIAILSLNTTRRHRIV
jgi:hypothetical protein